MIQDFTNYIAAKRAPSTSRLYTESVVKFLNWIGDRPLAELDLMTFTNYCLLLQKKYAPSSVNRFMVGIRVYWRFLERTGKIKNSWDYTDIPCPDSQSVPRTTAKPEHVLKMLNRPLPFTFKHLRDKTMIALIYATGMRIGELCKLDIHQIEPGKNTLRIEAANTKSKYGRNVYWDALTNKYLWTYISYRNELTNCDALFINTDRNTKGKRLTTRSVDRIFENYRKACGIIQHLVPHSLRGGWCTDGDDAGIPVTHRSRMMGHESLETTIGYEERNEKKYEKSYKKLADYRHKQGFDLKVYKAFKNGLL